MTLLPSNMHTANINMSKLDSAYAIDPLFHKMSESFDEGGSKGLLLGNLGVYQHECHIVFDSKGDGGIYGGVVVLEMLAVAAQCCCHIRFPRCISRLGENYGSET